MHTVVVRWKKHGYLVWYKIKQAERKYKKCTQVVVADTQPTFAYHVTQVSQEEV